MDCPHCKHPLSDDDVFDLVNKAAGNRVKRCAKHNWQPDLDWDENPIHSCANCGKTRPWEPS